MAQALKLAVLGGRSVAPNPMVGAVIVKKGKIIGKAYHQLFGGPHAEVLAIRSVKNKADLIDSTLYVTLEPCRHYGKTPPCWDLIMSVGIKRIVCGSRDPFQSSGFVVCSEKEHLRNTKNEPRIIFLKSKIAKKCTDLNKSFFTWVTQKRPYITVKIATSADGFVAGPKGASIHFTSPAQDLRVHRLRAAHQAIMVGAGTVLADNPLLTVRHCSGSNPLRVILDADRRIPKTLPTGQAGAKVFADNNFLHITKHIPLKTLFRQLAKKGIASILVEPGPTLYALLKKANLIDQLIILKGRKKIRHGLFIKI